MKPISHLSNNAPVPRSAGAPAPPAKPKGPKDTVEVGGGRTWGHAIARGAFATIGGVGAGLAGFAAGAVRHAGDNSVEVPKPIERSVRIAGAALGAVRGVLCGVPFGPAGVAVGLVLGPILGAAVGGALTGGFEAGVDATKGGTLGMAAGAKRGFKAGAALADRLFGPKAPNPEPPAPPAPTPPAPEPPAPQP